MKYILALYMGLYCLLSLGCGKIINPYIPKCDNVRITDWEVDSDGLVSAEWEYCDGRIGGTDFTHTEHIPELIENQRHLPKCTNCDNVTDEGTCWKHSNKEGTLNSLINQL